MSSPNVTQKLVVPAKMTSSFCSSRFIDFSSLTNVPCRLSRSVNVQFCPSCSMRKCSRDIQGSETRKSTLFRRPTTSELPSGNLTVRPASLPATMVNVMSFDWFIILLRKISVGSIFRQSVIGLLTSLQFEVIPNTRCPYFQMFFISYQVEPYMPKRQEFAWIEISCLTASRWRLCFLRAVAFGLPLNEIKYHGSKLECVAWTYNAPAKKR